MTKEEEWAGDLYWGGRWDGRWGLRKEGFLGVNAGAVCFRRDITNSVPLGSCVSSRMYEERQDQLWLNVSS